MSDDIREGQDLSDTDNTASNNGEESRANLSRRKFTKAGLIAPPVLMTLFSRPALGAYQCTVSGGMSGNLSNIDHNVVCRGKSPGWWKNNSDSFWSQAGFSRSDKFHPMFSTHFHNYGNLTLQEVMDLPGHLDPNQVGFQAVGALLNAGLFGDEFGFNTFQIMYAWNNYFGPPGDLAHDLEILNHRWESPPSDINQLILDWSSV